MGNGRSEGHRPNPLAAPKGEVEWAGRTVEEAIERALASIGLDRKDVDVEVIDEGSRGVLGLGAREARVRVRPRSEANPADVIRAVAEELIGLMGFNAVITAAQGPESVRVEVEGENLGALIGKHGQTLAAMEALAALMSGRRLGVPVRIEMDIMGYRDRRRVVLEALAQRTADRVIRTGREVALTPMDARDRRIVHLTLQVHPAVTTASRDEGDLRRVVVMPRSGTDAAQERQEEPGKGLRPPRESRQGSGEIRNQRPKVEGTRSSPPERGGNQKYSGRWTSGSRPGRFRERSYPAARGPGRGPNRKPAGPGTPVGAGGRPDGLPVDEELEAEIQAHLEKIDRGRGANRPESEPPTGSSGAGEPSRSQNRPKEE